MEIRLMPVAGGDGIPISIEVEKDEGMGNKVVNFWQDETPVWFTLKLADLQRALKASKNYVEG